MGMAGVIAVAGFSVQSRRSSALHQDVAARTAAANASVLALVGEVTKLQGEMQRAIRERDPDELERLISAIEGLEKSSASRVNAFGADGEELNTHLSALKGHNASVLQAVLVGEYASAQEAFIEKAAPASQSLLALLNRIAGQRQEAARQQLDRSEAASRTMQSLIMVLVILVLGASGTLTWFVIRRVKRSLGTAVEEISLSAEQINNAAAQVSKASQALAEGASQQVSTLAQTSVSSREINTTSDQNASSTRTASALMADTAASVEDAGRKMNFMVDSVRAIGASSEGISRIIKVIDDIAFQTNILALNAAVEAARAGEAGMGFAVVADEVRNLAQRCAQAARDTTGLIEESIRRAKEGGGNVQAMELSLGDITAKTQQARQLVESVNKASQAQAEGTRTISRAVAQIEMITQQAAANAEQNAAAGEQLSAQASSLRDVIAKLEELVGAR